MKNIILILCSVFFSSTLFADVCRKYTPEQLDVISNAYRYGLQYNYGYTLAAIAIKESFLGGRVLRYNPNDPSTGVTHIQFGTLKDLSGLNHWDAVDEAQQLIKNDLLSFEYTVRKLDSIKGTLWNKWKRYNGKGPATNAYARDIQVIISNLKKCNVIKYASFPKRLP